LTSSSIKAAASLKPQKNFTLSFLLPRPSFQVIGKKIIFSSERQNKSASKIAVITQNKEPKKDPNHRMSFKKIMKRLNKLQHSRNRNGLHL
jgi:hypothetical protein